MANTALNGLADPRLVPIEDLTRETFTLWNERRVGFSWRSYYMNHTLRVRANAISLGVAEGADPEVLAYAATLHDITKCYDGPYKVDGAGKRVVNKDGLWVNEPLMPARNNIITKWYDDLGLYYQVHHDSGAEVARKLLAERGFPSDFADRVAHVIRGHLRPMNPPWTLGGADDPFGDPESCALYDADTIDANLGAVAFYRFVQIHGYRSIQEKGSMDLQKFAESVAGWVERKREFVGDRLTETGRAVAADRLENNRVIANWLDEERRSDEIFRTACTYGVMGLVDFFLQAGEDPDLDEQLAEIHTEWLPARRRHVADGSAPPAAGEAIERAASFIRLLEEEIEGKI